MKPGRVNAQKFTARLLFRRQSFNNNNVNNEVINAPNVSTTSGARGRFSGRRKSSQTNIGIVSCLEKRPYVVLVVVLVVLCCPYYVLFTMRAASRDTTSLAESKQHALRGAIQDDGFLLVDVPAEPPRTVMSVKVLDEKPKTPSKIDNGLRKEPTTKEDDGDELLPTCTRSPLWEESVETAEYQFGCQEIEVSSDFFLRMRVFPR